MTDHPMGEVLRDGDRRGLRYMRRLGHPPTKVWRALTESEHLRSWMPCDIVGERAAGAPIVLPFWPEVAARYDVGEEVPTGEIRVWDPPRIFEWTWDGDLLRWELEPEGDAATVLTFTTWVGDSDPDLFTSTAAGYHVCLEHLSEVLDTGSAPSVATADPSALESRYADLVANAS